MRIIQRIATNDALIAVVIPCYRATRHVLGVISSMPDCVGRIYVVDDACPDGSGRLVAERCSDPRVTVVWNEVNVGVGGAVLAGYTRALEDGAGVLVKVDGDGQMDPSLIPNFVEPILSGEADYTKGNRFYDLTGIGRMPPVRLIGNAVLSFMSKLSTGYWDIFDPNNGYTALHAEVAKRLPFDKISKRYFFETDMLFRLGTLRAVVLDIPMDSHYADEISSLSVPRVIGEFTGKHVRNFFKRIFYSYYLRDMSVASLELVAGVLLIGFGAAYGLAHWIRSYDTNAVTTAGTVMLAALPILVGLQFVLAFLGYDIASVPRRPIHATRVPAPRLHREAAPLAANQTSSAKDDVTP